MPLKKGRSGHASIADLLNSSTFLESLSPDERTDIFCAARSANQAASPQAKERRSGISQWNASKDSYLQQEHPEYGNALSQHPATADAAIPAVQQAYDALDLLDSSHGAVQLVAASEFDQLQRARKLWQKQEGQLQAKITSLQYQVSMLLANQKAAKAQGNERLASLEAVITRLQGTMSEVGATAARVAQENRSLSAENRQLTVERVQHLELMQQMKAHCRHLEADLLTKVTAASQQAAEAATTAASPLNALVTPALLAATAPPPGAGSSNDNSVLAGGVKVTPALQEAATLKRLRVTLQKQVVQLQQQLSAAEREQQEAAAAAAAERARTGRLFSKTQQQLAAALQRLQHMVDREQQQQSAMQEREDYIARLEQCLLEQHQQLSLKAAAAVGAVPLRSRSTSSNKSRPRAPVPRAGAVHRLQTLSSSLFPGASPTTMHSSGTVQQQLTVQGSDTGNDALLYTDAMKWAGGAVAGPDTGVDADQEPETSAAVAAAAELLMQHQQRRAASAQTGVSSTAATTQLSGASATTSPDVNAAKRAAMARQCMNVMLTGSPEGKLALRSSTSAAQTAVGAADAEAAVDTTAAQEVPTSCQKRESPRQQQRQRQLGGLQQLQQSRLQQWQQRQLQHHQHANKSAGNFLSSAGSSMQQRKRSAASGAVALGGKAAGWHQQPPRGGAVHLQHQQRQQRLRELLQQKQLRQHPQQAKLRAVQQPLQQKQSLALRQQKHQQNQQQDQQQSQQLLSEQQSLVESEGSSLEAQTQWQELQAEVQQMQDTKVAPEINHSRTNGSKSAALPYSHTTTTLHAIDSQIGFDLEVADKDMAATAVPDGMCNNHVAACGAQHQQQHILQQQRLAELLGESSEEELSVHELADKPAGAAGGHRDMQAPAHFSGCERHAPTRLFSEDQLVARVVEMQQNLQLLEGQLLQLGCS